MSSTAEYDAFGPWIYEIHTEEEIPRLFRGHPIDLAASLLTIKVPREIERREANPAMDLYDMVVSLGPEVMTVLTRRGREVDTRTLAYADILGITEVVDLLRGELTLYAAAGPLRVPFNATSTDIVAHLVQLLRRQYLSAPGTSTPAQAAESSVPREVGDDLQNLYRRLARDEGLGRTLAVQRRHLVTPVGASGVGKAVARVWPTALQSSVITMGEREIVVLHRARHFVTGRRPEQSIAHTILPIERITEVDVRPSQAHEGVSALLLRVGQVAHEFPLDSGTATKVAAELKRTVGR